ncbi:hypothetical protein BDW59DRAFT_132000 [Aspergillus cavernicola]|uniref:SRR1-like domain-containing protein n=1 Tax=Aspergillus cavernicola TaxID=176166 RepID=A0ABR4HPR2_9EURO
MVHFMVGPSYRVEEPNVTTLATPSEALSRIDEWYNTEKLFFPRDSIKAIYQQLQRPLKKGDEIFVKGLDGVNIAFLVRTGDSYCYDGEEYTIGEPFIRYISYESLKATMESSLELQHLAYCNLQIQHYVTSHHQGPGEPMANIVLKSLSEVEHLFSTCLRVWEVSEVWAQIKTAVSSANTASIIGKIIGLACGTMSYPDDIPYYSYNSVFQHALLVATRRFLQERFNCEIACAVQDPAYTDIDKSVLRSYGIKVLEDPEGFLEIDEASLVFSCAPNLPVKQIVLDMTRPALLIWDTVHDEDGKLDGYLEADPDSSRVIQIMSRSYETGEFPQNEHFGDMAIYVRREVDSKG